MIKDTLTPMAERNAHKSVLDSYIIKSKEGRFSRVRAKINEMDLLQHVDSRILEILSPDKLSLSFSGPMERFNLFSGIISRKSVFELAQDRDIDKIYHDQKMNILSTRPETSRDRGNIFTSTEWTREALGVNKVDYTGSGVSVSIIDTGMRRTHPQVPTATRMVSTMPDKVDKSGHGTHVGSIAAGQRVKDQVLSRRLQKDIYAHGMAPDSRLINIKSLGYVIGTGSTSAIIRGIQESVDRGSDIINMSLGGKLMIDSPEESPYFEVFERMAGEGVLPVTAVGNSGPSTGSVGVPAALPYNLSVGAIEADDRIASFSSRGPTPWGEIKPDCVSYGVEVNSGITGALDGADKSTRRFSYVSGTSQAAPHVSGLLSIMKEIYNDYNLTFDLVEIKDMLEALGDKPKDNDYGFGRLDMDMIITWLDTEYNINLL